MLRCVLVTLGLWLVLLSGIGIAGRWFGVDAEWLRHLRWDAALLSAVHHVREPSWLLSLGDGLILLLLAGWWRPSLPSRPVVPLLLGLSFLLSFQSLQLAAARLGRQVRAQMGTSDEEKRAAWISYQCADYEAWARCREEIPEDATILIRTDENPRSKAQPPLLGYFLMPRKCYREFPGLRSPLTDWVITIRGGRVADCKVSRERAEP